MWDQMHDVVSADGSEQVYLDELIEKHAAEHPFSELLDLGCGTGSSIDLFRRVAPGARWVGVDIGSSPEVNARTRSDAEFHTFDGVKLPFESDRFPFVFSRQVLEHVRHPEPLLAEVRRVLQPGGWFLGSTSHLEPYHSFSIFNFTPYGFRVIAEDAGLEVVRIHPGIDSLTLITRLLSGRKKYFGRFWREESPVNRWIGWRQARSKRSAKQANIRKLLFCGQFSFELRKPR